MEKEGKDSLFLLEMENTLTGLCHYASNCFICFHKGRIYNTGCKQLQVKGQCIYYPTRKGNAYFIQSASASHLGCHGHLVYWMISLQAETQLALNTIFKVSCVWRRIITSSATWPSLSSAADTEIDCPLT